MTILFIPAAWESSEQEMRSLIKDEIRRDQNAVLMRKRRANKSEAQARTGVVDVSEQENLAP